MLPAIAVLHPRHGRLRESGTILATIGGTATVVVGLAASVNADLRTAALFILGVWWWTVGKMWAETEVLPRPLGIATAVLGVLAFGAALLPASWPLAQLVLGAWLLALAVGLARTS